MPSPGPGAYRYPSEFGQYISEKARFRSELSIEENPGIT
jgi:hypothetical protein